MAKSSGFVYLIGSHNFRWYKIGKSITPDIRLKEIGILLPFKIELIALWRCWSPSVEAHLHHLYANNHVNGEWFRFSKNELAEVISTPVWNATLMIPSEFAAPSSLTKLTNIEHESKVKIRGVNSPSPEMVVQHILSRKLRQALKNYPEDC